MNWEAVAAAAELLGAVGVIVSLLYVAAQVRQNTKVAKAATRQAIASDAQGLAADLVNVEDVARTLQDRLDGKPLEPYQLLRLQARAYRDFRFWDNTFFQYRENMLTDEEWQGFRENLKLMLHVPAYRDYWQRESALFAEAFRAEVAELLSESTEAGGSVLIDSERRRTSPAAEND